ncbi:hypothetical protein NN561_016953 [Cricetulus griseus]
MGVECISAFLGRAYPLLPTPGSSLVTSWAWTGEGSRTLCGCVVLGEPGASRTPVAWRVLSFLQRAEEMLGKGRHPRGPGRHPRRSPSLLEPDAHPAATDPSRNRTVPGTKPASCSRGLLLFLAPAALLGTGRSPHLGTPGRVVQPARPSVPQAPLGNRRSPRLGAPELGYPGSLEAWSLTMCRCSGLQTSRLLGGRTDLETSANVKRSCGTWARPPRNRNRCLVSQASA